MERSARELRNDLHHLRSLLQREIFLFLSDEEKNGLVEDSLKLIHKLDTFAESLLTVGLLGGTGVGKSTLMNALAGSTISAASHRRPYTDQVLIYRHAAASLPKAIEGSPWPSREILHEADAVRQIVLCDLPDFDSLMGRHRQIVEQFLQHLDLLVWVTSPEKYADERFYTFLREVPKARENFYFVLNKTDLLFRAAEPENGYRQLMQLTARFSQHLRDHGIDQPIICAVSALEGWDSGAASPWNQLASFRGQIFRLRDAREVTAIKTANLDLEVRKLTRFLEREVLAQDTMAKILRASAHTLRGRQSEWVRIGEEGLARALDRHLGDEWYQPVNPEVLIGFGRIIATAVGDWRRFSARSCRSVDVVDAVLEPESLPPLRDAMQRLETEIVYEALHQGLPPAVSHHLKRSFDADLHWSDFWQRLRHGVTDCFERYGKHSAKGLRRVQYATYTLLFALLLLALSGEAVWRNLWEHPHWSGLIQVAAAIAGTLFSPNGLAALGSAVLLQIYLGLRFYGHYKKLLQRHAQRFIESLKRELGRLWEEELNVLIKHLETKAEEVEGRVASLSPLSRSGEEG